MSTVAGRQPKCKEVTPITIAAGSRVYLWYTQPNKEERKQFRKGGEPMFAKWYLMGYCEWNGVLLLNLRLPIIEDSLTFNEYVEEISKQIREGKAVGYLNDFADRVIYKFTVDER